MSIAENFLHLIRANNKFTQEEAKILDLCLILHAEHGGEIIRLSLLMLFLRQVPILIRQLPRQSAFKGPKHGGANNRVMGMMNEIKSNVKNWTDENEDSAYIAKIINKEAYDRSGLVYGFGHAVYTISDPRAVLLKKSARDLAAKKGRMEEFELYNIIEKVTPRLFAELKNNNKPLPANIDFYSGFVYSLLDIPPELYTLFLPCPV